jgi:hypothetical protein
VIFKIEAHGNLLVELNEYRSYHFIYLLLTGVVKKQLLRGQERGSAVSFDMAASASVYSDVSFSDFSSSAYRGILDVLRYATDDNRDSGIPWSLNTL